MRGKERYVNTKPELIFYNSVEMVKGEIKMT